MPPRLSIWGACRPLALRPRPQPLLQQPRLAALARPYSGDTTPSQPPNGAANLPPRGSTVPHIPQSMMRPGDHPPIREEDVQMREPTEKENAIQQLQMAAYGVDPFSTPGLKFEEPPMPQAKLHLAQYHMKHRYEEGISQFTRLMMRDGKLSKAQSDMAMVLTFLRTAPAPKMTTQRPLLPGAPPPEHLPLNPSLYLMLAVDSVAPLIRIRGFTGLAGGGKSLEVPVPISRRTRRRMAWMWLMDAVSKKPSMGSGKKQFAHRIGEEIVAIIEGRSSVWTRRDQLHKLGTSVRANVNSSRLRKYKK